MSKIKLTFVAAAICGGLLALAPMSGAFAAPMAPIGKAANAIDPRSVVYYDGYYRRHYRHYGYYHRPYYRHYGYYHGHYRHCWWRYGRRICRWWYGK